MRRRRRRLFPGERLRRPRWNRRLEIRLAIGLGSILVVYATFVAVTGPKIDDALAALQLSGLLTRILGLAIDCIVALAFAVAGALLLSRGMFGRLRQFANQVRTTERGELPGPFNDNGHDEIAFLARSMNAMRDQIDDRLRELNLKDIRRREWIAQVSHDIRTPLTAQLACLDRAIALVDGDDSPLRRNQLRELMSIAKLDSDRVHVLADDLLEIARLDAGDQLRLEPVPPGEIVRQAVRSLEPLAAQRGVTLEVEVTSRLPVLQADGRRLMRAIENLIRNAIQHARSSVEVLAMLSENCVRFEVRDDGAGLPKQPGFLEFLRKKSSDVRLTELAKRRSRADSAGLGLVVTQRVAEAHRGVVDAYNLSRGGAAFWLDIPISEEPAPPQVDAV